MASENFLNKPLFVMPYPAPVVVWRTGPGCESAFAVVTKVGRHAIDVLVFPAEIRVGVPKTGVRHASDPWHKLHGLDVNAGVWEPTDETRTIETLKECLDGMGRELEDLKAIWGDGK